MRFTTVKLPVFRPGACPGRRRLNGDADARPGQPCCGSCAPSCATACACGRGWPREAPQSAAAPGAAAQAAQASRCPAASVAERGPRRGSVGRPGCRYQQDRQLQPHNGALGLRTCQGQVGAHLLAIPIDRLIVAGSVILAAGSSLGWLGIALGVAATLFANLQFGLPHDIVGGHVDLVSRRSPVHWPCFMLERWLRARRRRARAAAPSGPSGVALVPIPTDAQNAAEMALRATHVTMEITRCPGGSSRRGSG